MSFSDKNGSGVSCEVDEWKPLPLARGRSSIASARAKASVMGSEVVRESVSVRQIDNESVSTSARAKASRCC